MDRLLDFEDSLGLRSGCLVTINLQHLYEAYRRDEVRQLLFESGDICMCIDGRGAGILLSRHRDERVPLAVGNEIARARLDSSQGQTVLVVGSDVATLSALKRLYPATKFLHDSSRVSVESRSEAAPVVERILEEFGTSFNFALIALGVPKQEFVGSELSRQIGAAPVYCIGGSLEMIAGRLRRAPRLLRWAGLEGLWRFLLQPTRARYWRFVDSYRYFAYFLVRPSEFDKLVGRRRSKVHPTE